MFKPLLAKSFSIDEKNNDVARGSAKYTGHISLVMQAADILVDKLGHSILQQLGIKHIDLDYFAATVKLGAYLHDWGKANQHFQEMVYLKTLEKSTDPNFQNLRKQIVKLSNQHSNRQMLRHEVISSILALQVPTFRKWLEECQDANLMIAIWAAIGHHLKIGVNQNNQAAEFIAEIPSGVGDELIIYTDHGDFQAVLKMGHQALGLPATLPELPPEIWTKSQLKTALLNLRNEFIQFESQLDWEQQKFIAAVKATVIAADLAGSALPLAEENFKVWIEQVLSLQLSKQDIQKLVNQKLKGKKLREFQQKIANSEHSVTLVKAGCGTGKTIAAYAWGEKWAIGRKLFFSYPTTGTASQGYIDYADGTEIEAALMHSRADLDRELLFSGDSDDSEGINARLMAFQAWRKKLIICTVDSVLGLIQNNRKPLYSWAAIAQGAFVFDEVHAYDPRLFGALLKFIKAFRGAPILLMSASFTPQQLQAIRQVLAEQGEELDKPIEGPKELEELKRYEIKYVPQATDFNELDQIWQPVIEALKNQQKVLWVTNSVKTCIEIYRTAKTKLTENLPGLDIPPLIYHSRYRYKDRLKKHQAVIEAFQKDEPVLAITTQVCEMSLDLSADLLISAMAPAASLIQRLGRLNRRMAHQEEGSKLAIIYSWNNSQPYNKAELSTGEQLIQEFSGKTGISQQDLAQVAASLNLEKVEQIRSSWLEDNWCNRPDFLREGGYTITVLLGEDETKIWHIAEQNRQKLLKQGINESRMKLFKKEAQAWSVPIRIEADYWEWERRGFYPITPMGRISYNEDVGAEQ
ncbi:CRISPR-associated helicase Cas3' [Nostoc sp. FACHB-87]|uniref:CRISPR-associated helicase Cas3' n=1 Tax=Nostocaceae TaxID=1162 RepID=UPI001686D4BF|nr:MULTISPECIES: CRISPR-associated helicase Cas3' [Nostocaceae]MBD2455368.1 CRISPR-associated helicase Cas3' [Nostoc sp. FACHB-87]MBD2475768.1 CRISPR-associated helicase Cas3' [Anabaena sp. FACHB-83]